MTLGGLKEEKEGGGGGGEAGAEEGSHSLLASATEPTLAAESA